MSINPEYVPSPDTPQHKILMKIASDLRGQSAEWIIWAVLNLLINVLRHTYSNRRDAEDRFDELTARSKAMLMTHYGHDDKRRGVIPIGSVQ